MTKITAVINFHFQHGSGLVSIEAVECLSRDSQLLSKQVSHRWGYPLSVKFLDIQ